MTNITAKERYTQREIYITIILLKSYDRFREQGYLINQILKTDEYT